MFSTSSTKNLFESKKKALNQHPRRLFQTWFCKKLETYLLTRNWFLTFIKVTFVQVQQRRLIDFERVFIHWEGTCLKYFDDFSSGVQCAAVNVICELARKNPKNYLALAPLFFKLMTTSSNNWMLIKIIKLVIQQIQACWTSTVNGLEQCMN